MCTNLWYVVYSLLQHNTVIHDALMQYCVLYTLCMYIPIADSTLVNDFDLIWENKYIHRANRYNGQPLASTICV